MTLEARRLSLAYDRTPVVQELDLELPQRRITALIGANGSGKSTLLRGLGRLLKPRGGGVYLDGQAISSLPTRAVARRMGILPQGPTAPEGLTVRELVAQGRYPHQSLFQQWTEADESAAESALAITGLSELADRPLDTLSGGQRQRGWIAMVLAQQTELLLLDEPTTFLDLAHQIEVLDLVAHLNEAEGRTVVLVLHDINQACRYAHHLVALRNGAVVAEGDPARIVTASLIREVFGIDCHVMPDPVTGSPLCVPLSGRTPPSRQTRREQALRRHG